MLKMRVQNVLWIFTLLFLFSSHAHAQPNFTKQFTPDTVLVGETTTLEFVIENTTGSPLTGVSFIDDFPPGLEVANPTNAGVSGECSGDLTPMSGDTSIVTLPTVILPFGVCVVTVDVISTTPGEKNNVTGDLFYIPPGPPVSASDTLQVNELPGFSKAFQPDVIFDTQQSTLEFTITNTSDVAVTDLAFLDIMPSPIRVSNPVVSDTGICGGTLDVVAGSDLVIYSGGSLGAASSCIISVSVTPLNPGLFTNISGDLTSSLGNSGNATDDIEVLPEPPGFSKAFQPDVIFDTQQSTLEFTITNNSGVAVTDLAFLDIMPSPIRVSNPVVSDTGICGGTLDVVAGSDLVIYSGGSLGAASSCIISVSVTPLNTGLFTNTSGDLTSSSGNSGNATDDIEVLPEPPGFSKAFDVDSMAIGDVTTLTFTIDNSTGAVQADDVAFTDNLPAGLVIATPRNLTEINCASGQLSAQQGGTSISWSNGIVFAGFTCTISVDVEATTSGLKSNVSGDLTSSLGNSGQATDDITILEPLGFSKAFDVDSMAIGDVTTLTFTIDNSTGAVQADDVAFTDNLPAGLVIATPPNLTPINCSSGQLSAQQGGTSISWSSGIVLASFTCTISVDVEATTSGLKSNVSGDLTSSLGNSGQATDDITILEPLGFSKAFDVDSMAIGDVTTLTFTIDNSTGAVQADDVAFTDNLPAGLVIATPRNLTEINCASGQLSAQQGGTSISWSSGIVLASFTCTISVDVEATTSGLKSNVSGDLTSSLGNSGPATDDITVLEPLGFSKAFAVDSMATGDVTTLTFTIDNSTGAVQADDVAFTDNLPAGLVIATPRNLTEINCASGQLSAQQGGTSISWSNGIVFAGFTCTISVDVEATTSGFEVQCLG